jgi:hypothetical protein
MLNTAGVDTHLNLDMGVNYGSNLKWKPADRQLNSQLVVSPPRSRAIAPVESSSLL